jgi:hypothetical protein
MGFQTHFSQFGCDVWKLLAVAAAAVSIALVARSRLRAVLAPRPAVASENGKVRSIRNREIYQ